MKQRLSRGQIITSFVRIANSRCLERSETFVMQQNAFAFPRMSTNHHDKILISLQFYTNFAATAPCLLFFPHYENPGRRDCLMGRARFQSSRTFEPANPPSCRSAAESSSVRRCSRICRRYRYSSNSQPEHGSASGSSNAYRTSRSSDAFACSSLSIRRERPTRCGEGFAPGLHPIRLASIFARLRKT